VETDPAALAAGPYRTPHGLAARTAVYAWQQPRIDLIGAAVDALAALPDGAVVVDVGFGGTSRPRSRPRSSGTARCAAAAGSVSSVRGTIDNR